MVPDNHICSLNMDNLFVKSEDDEGGYSAEPEMLSILKDILQETDYIFHSWCILNDWDNIREEHEADFIIFRPEIGIVILECKNIAKWEYNNHDKQYVIKSGKGSGKCFNPYDQVLINKKTLCENIEKAYHGSIKDNLKHESAVWWYKDTNGYEQITMEMFGPQATENNTIIGKNKKNVKEKIEGLFAIKLQIRDKNNNPKVIQKKPLSREQSNWLLNHYFLRHREKRSAEELTDILRERLTENQMTVFRYLSQVRTAAVSGKAGTGKTRLAVGQARKYSKERNGKTLLLTFNFRLKNSLVEENHEYADWLIVNNIDGWVSSITNMFWDRNDNAKQAEVYTIATNKLKSQFSEGTFEYKHILIDEGQDFADKSEVMKKAVLDLLFEYVQQPEAKLETMCIFYDDNQMIQGNGELPKICQEAEGKLSLYLNCRNTKEIAETVEGFLDIAKMGGEGCSPNKREPLKNVLDDGIDIILSNNEYPRIGNVHQFVDEKASEKKKKDLKKIMRQEAKNCVNRIIKDEVEKYGTRPYDIQIISCGGVKNSVLFDNNANDNVSDSKEYGCSNGKFEVINSRTYKGLEAKVVIVVDIDGDLCLKKYDGRSKMWNDRLLPYVATSRAKSRLYVVGDFDFDFCNTVIENKFPGVYKEFGKNKEGLKKTFKIVCEEVLHGKKLI